MMKLKNFCFWSILCLLFFSCKDNEQLQLPKNVLSEEKYVKILIQEHILEGYINTQIKNVDSAMALYTQEHLKLLQKFNIQSVNYDSTVTFYARNPKALQSVYAKVTDSLTVLETKLK